MLFAYFASSSLKKCNAMIA
jgi:hypothetical protein